MDLLLFFFTYAYIWSIIHEHINKKVRSDHLHAILFSLSIYCEHNLMSKYFSKYYFNYIVFHTI